MSTQTRQPAGVPTGGQFAASTRTEPAVALTGDAREAVVDRMVADLLETGAVHPDSQGIGVHIELDDAAGVAAASALGLPDDQDPDEASVGVARDVVRDAIAPDPAAKFWTGQDTYWTDDLHGLCGQIADAVHAAQAR